jgi:hypothetical protein
VGEKEIHRLLAIEREKQEAQCACPMLDLPAAHSAFTEAMLSANSVGTWGPVLLLTSRRSRTPCPMADRTREAIRLRRQATYVYLR